MEDINLEHTYHDLDIIGRVIKESAQISLSEIKFLRLELKQANENFNLKKHEIEYMKKGKESSNSMYKWEIDILSLG